ncbi:MAG TPA: hypothetical protein VHY21_08215 [Pseudonocardiaceae bacterium]|jgi:hypothetical protein|nr:hypothetical protein [Pseudonocardiaceae bacterium]
MTQYKLPPASAYADGPSASQQRFEDYKLIREGKPPIHGITEADASPELDVVIPPLHELRVSDPEAFNELRRAFADNVFAGHDGRSGGGRSPFNRGVGA